MLSLVSFVSSDPLNQIGRRDKRQEIEEESRNLSGNVYRVCCGGHNDFRVTGFYA
jgi:hypothetical protein